MSDMTILIVGTEVLWLCSSAALFDAWPPGVGHKATVHRTKSPAILIRRLPTYSASLYGSGLSMVHKKYKY